MSKNGREACSAGVNRDKIVKYALCLKVHGNLGGKMDGCQEFLASNSAATLECAACGCHRNFHRKDVMDDVPVKYITKVVYTKCNKIHYLHGCNTVDGCQEFTASSEEDKDDDGSLFCAICHCHKVFHQNEVTVRVS